MDFPQRKNIRLELYDYSTSAAYFVTVCTHERRPVLSSVCRGDPCGRPQPSLTEYGRIVERCFDEVSSLYAVSFDKHIIMPDHVHFICQWDEERATARVAPTLGRIVGALKSIAANQCRIAGLKGKLWQRGYYDHVIRNEQDYRETWDYIETNPARWLERRGLF